MAYFMSMKKIIIGIAVLGIYAVYSLGIRHNNPIIAKPASLANNNNNSGGASTSSSSGSSSSASSNSTSSSSSTAYKDGTYTGNVEDAYYGSVQVSVTISGGRITNVKFLQYPNTHQVSVIINQQAMPYLKQEAIQSQSSNVQLISGATFTSQAFVQSLQSALNKA